MCDKPEGQRTRHDHVALALITTLILAVFARVLTFGFVWDDKSLLRDNSALQRSSTLWRAFASDFWELSNVPRAQQMYRPLVTLSYWVEHRLFGGAPAGYHAVSVTLHALVAAAVFGLARSFSLSASAATCAALLFALHPAHDAAVGNIASRTDLLATAFSLLSILSLRKGRTLPSAVLLGLALLSKESAVVVPLWLMLLGCDAPWSVPRTPRSALRVAWPLAVLAAYFVLRGLALGRAAPRLGGQASYGGALLLRYVARLVWSTPMSPIVHIAAPTAAWRLVSLALVLVGLAVLTWFARRSVPARLALAGFLGLLPVAEIVPVGARFADLLLYLPMVPLVLVVVRGLAPRSVAMGIAVVGLVPMLLMGQLRLGMWRDDLHLWQQAASLAPDEPTVMMNYANALAASRQTGVACALQARARALAAAQHEQDTFARSTYNLGNCALRAGDLDAAAARFREAWSASYGALWPAGSNLTVTLMRQGHAGDAMRFVRSLSALHPAQPSVWTLRAQVAAALADWPDARASAQRALALSPSDGVAARVLAESRRHVP